MEQVETPVRRFFESYARANESGDMAKTAAQFADVFMAAGPQGAQCVKAADFAVALPKRKELFQRLGSRATALVALEERALDARFVLAKTRWRMEFEREGRAKEELFVESTFLLDCGADPVRIVLYLAHQDIMAVLRERGILAA